VNLFRCLKCIPDLLESRSKLRTADPLSEALAVAEQQGLELVHHDVGKETLGIEALTHRIADLREQSILDSGCLLGERKPSRQIPTGPRSFASLWQCIVIHHATGKALWVLLEVSHDILL